MARQDASSCKHSLRTAAAGLKFGSVTKEALKSVKNITVDIDHVFEGIPENWTWEDFPEVPMTEILEERLSMMMNALAREAGVEETEWTHSHGWGRHRGFRPEVPIWDCVTLNTTYPARYVEYLDRTRQHRSPPPSMCGLERDNANVAVEMQWLLQCTRTAVINVFVGKWHYRVKYFWDGNGRLQVKDDASEGATIHAEINEVPAGKDVD